LAIGTTTAEAWLLRSPTAIVGFFAGSAELAVLPFAVPQGRFQAVKRARRAFRILDAEL